MSKLSGKEFDCAYVEHELKDHRKNVSQFTAHAKTLTDPQVREWVSGTLPVLKEHVLIAKSLTADLKNGSEKEGNKR